tara:strand:+ start:3683 stop:3877 length:195 start_codon:yes stop_codon:yes gene_type:complete
MKLILIDATENYNQAERGDWTTYFINPDHIVSVHRCDGITEIVMTRGGTIFCKHTPTEIYNKKL